MASGNEDEFAERSLTHLRKVCYHALLVALASRCRGRGHEAAAGGWAHAPLRGQESMGGGGESLVTVAADGNRDIQTRDAQFSRIAPNC